MFFKKDERRKEERSKQGQTNNKAKKQHSIPKAVTFPKKNELFASGGTRTHDTLHSSRQSNTAYPTKAVTFELFASGGT